MGLLLHRPAGASQNLRSPELLAEEQRVIGMTLPTEQISGFSPASESPGAAGLRALRSNARLFVVHLWATWCAPCVEEFPHLKKAFPNGRYGEAQLVLIAVQSPPAELRAFLQKHAADLPAAPHYVDSTGALPTALKLPKLPLTLLVDRQWNVKQVFYSPITERRSELISSIDHYLSPPRLTATGGSFLQCASPPCLMPSFFLHRSLSVTHTSRWNQRRRAPGATSLELPVAAQPNLIYLFTPGCARCLLDLAELQRIARGWSKTRSNHGSFLALVVSPDPDCAARLLERQPELQNILIVHSSMPQLIELMQAEGAAVTLIMNRQGYIRNAFVGPFAQYKVAATDALYLAAQGR
ncbi:MAG: TlpA disulfide reductase family protein [Polyangia bacterium]